MISISKAPRVVRAPKWLPIISRTGNYIRRSYFYLHGSVLDPCEAVLSSCANAKYSACQFSAE